MIRDEDLRSSFDYSEGQKAAALLADWDGC